MDARFTGLIIFALVLAAGAAGYAFARRNLGADSATAPLGPVQAATFGILSLLLAFSFSVGLARYDARRAIVVHEANAIGTLWYRADLLDRARAEALHRELRAYTTARYAFSDSSDERVRADAALHATELQHSMWATLRAGADYRYSAANLVIQAFNDTVDAAAEQVELQGAPIPPSVIAVLTFTAVVAALILGASYGGATRRRALIAPVLVAVVIALVITTIVDLDRPHSGVIRVDREPLRLAVP
jgi:hypothetical protein